MAAIVQPQLQRHYLPIAVCAFCGMLRGAFGIKAQGVYRLVLRVVCTGRCQEESVYIAPPKSLMQMSILRMRVLQVLVQQFVQLF